MIRFFETNEEAAFRGYGLERLCELTGSKSLAAVVTWFLFTIVQPTSWGWGQVIIAAFGGLILTLLYVWRGNLWANIVAHWLTDGSAFILLPLLMKHHYSLPVWSSQFGLSGLLESAGGITPVLRKGFRETPMPESESKDTVAVTLRVNGKDYPVRIDPRTSLLDCLREQLQLTGSKKGCDHGQCGACTVHIDGRRVNSCLCLAAMHEGEEITTIEGLGQPGNLHPVQEAFVACDAYQCGYCTSGQIMSAVALLKEPCGAEDADVKEFMSGNICRCGAYPNIVAAIQSARGNARAEEEAA
ncbi:MAG TPA: 2Fe-2S iron-sulfur cluster-binding protein [Chthoniobacterales bacterium]|nr:2Fe-2S iron-sulfur cluster-binding protein [Chthoniobacterales bacterium]